MIWSSTRHSCNLRKSRCFFEKEARSSPHDRSNKRMDCECRWIRFQPCTLKNETVVALCLACFDSEQKYANLIACYSGIVDVNHLTEQLTGDDVKSIGLFSSCLLDFKTGEMYFDCDDPTFFVRLSENSIKKIRKDLDQIVLDQGFQNLAVTKIPFPCSWKQIQEAVRKRS